jgi:hypothetical protein
MPGIGWFFIGALTLGAVFWQRKVRRFVCSMIICLIKRIENMLTKVDGDDDY